MANYRFNDKAGYVSVIIQGKEGPEEKKVKGIYPFGPQCQPVTDKNLTESMAQYLLGKDEFKEMIDKLK